MKLPEKIMHQGLDEDIFTGSVVLVSKDGRELWHEAFGWTDQGKKTAVNKNTFFDLASLTKPLATTPAIMLLVQKGVLSLSTRISEILTEFAGTPKSGITIRHLLRHNAGLPDYREYYRQLVDVPKDQRRSAMRAMLVREPLVALIGEKVVYSDLGFMILEWIIEKVAGLRLDRYIAENIYRPLDIRDLFFVDLETDKPAGPYAATEDCPWRGYVLEGLVHDENAYMMGGVAGHAGLFGTAGGMHRLLVEMISAYVRLPAKGVFEQKIINVFLSDPEKTGRALGFDMPSATGSQAGQYFSSNSFGHLGFTGTSFWMDLDKKIIVILLTNRVHPHRWNQAMKIFRPRFHDAVMNELLHQP